MFDDFDELEEEFEGEIHGTPKAAGGLLPPRESWECLGHEEVEHQLLDLFNGGNVPHALIFAGPEGIGKSTFAFRVARYLLKNGAGTGNAEDDSTGLFGDALPEPPKPESLAIDHEDRTFRQVASGGHPDILVIGRLFDDKKGRFKSSVEIDEVRRITPFMRMTASRPGGWRVVIVDDADTMNRNAQNAILKILEEPPPRAVLILVAHRPGRFIATIRSRCRTINFRAPEKEIFATLVKREEPGLTPQDIDALYDISGGSIGQAIRIIGEGGLEVIDKVATLFSEWPQRDWVNIHHLADNLAKPGQEDSLRAFQDVFMWVVMALTRAKARGEKPPAILDNPAFLTLMNSYSLPQWTEIAGKLQAHFDTVQGAALDRRHAVTGAFSFFEDAA